MKHRNSVTTASIGFLFLTQNNFAPLTDSFKELLICQDYQVKSNVWRLNEGIGEQDNDIWEGQRENVSECLLWIHEPECGCTNTNINFVILERTYE